jgi:ribosomal protein S18 acetylase RimI-like enzyme
MVSAGSLVQRPSLGAADLPSLLDLVRSRPPEHLADFPSLADLQEMLGMESASRIVQLWEDGNGKLRGFAILDDYQSWAFLIVEVAASFPIQQVEEQMIAWGEAQASRLARQRGGALPLEVHVRSVEAARMTLLETSGFARQPGGSLALSRPLAEPLPEPSLPPGFTIRPFAWEPEVEEWVRLHRLAWGTENMTVAERRAMLGTPFYDPALDLVAVAPDGSLAAYCVCWFSPEENLLTGRKDGYTDPIATHPAYQQRGLARALLLSGMRLLKERGIETARLGTARENLGMLRTAQGVGFRIVAETLWYSKDIP